MKRTISIKLDPTSKQKQALVEIQHAFANACNQIVPYVTKHRCWNRVALHHLAYYPIRESSNLGSQMICIAIKMVCDAYRALNIRKGTDVPAIAFKNKSIHYDKRTYSIKNNILSLYTLQGRQKIAMIPGDFQRSYLTRGILKEAKLIRRGQGWFFNLVLDLPDVECPGGNVLGVDLGENNIAATSSGKIFKGGKLCFNRDSFLNFRKRLQSNGSKSAKQLLKKVSGKEARHVKHVNHEISKAIIEEAKRTGSGVIALEKLTNIREHIKAEKRIRTRLHRWSWSQLQTFIKYKAEAAGIQVVFVSPAYTSRRCAVCGEIGSRVKHHFSCKCGNLAHADLNASQNIAGLALSIDSAMGIVTCPNVPLLSS